MTSDDCFKRLKEISEEIKKLPSGDTNEIEARATEALYLTAHLESLRALQLKEAIDLVAILTKDVKEIHEDANKSNKRTARLSLIFACLSVVLSFTALFYGYLMKNSDNYFQKKLIKLNEGILQNVGEQVIEKKKMDMIISSKVDSVFLLLKKINR